MVTFTDESTSDFPSLEAFLAARRILRAAATDQLAALRKDQRDALSELDKQFAIVRDELSKADAGVINSVRLNVELLAKQHAERSALKARFDGQISGIHDRYGLRRKPQQQNASDAQDYLHATDAYREDLREGGATQLDPVIENIPSVRRRREHGWTVYETPQLRGLLGQTEVLRCDDKTVVVRGDDFDRIKTGLLVASKQYAPPIRVTSNNPVFMERSKQAAAELGITIEVPDKTQQVAAEAADPAATTQSAEPAQQAPPSYAMQPDDERLSALKSQYGRQFASSVSKLGGTEIRGIVHDRIVGFWPDADALILLTDRAVLAVPVNPSIEFNYALGQEVRLIPDGHRCEIELLAQTQSRDGASAPSDAEEIGVDDAAITPARTQGR